MSCIWTSLPESSGGIILNFFRGQRRWILLCVLLLAPLMVSACGPIGDFTNKINDTFTSRPAPPDAPPPPGETLSLYDPEAAKPPPPPGAAERAPAPGQSGAPLLPNGLPALPPHGIDLEKQFAQPAKNEDERIKRVENAVVELRHNFDAIYPAIVRLVAVEQDMQDLTRQLGTLLQNEPQSSAAAGGVGGPERVLPPPDSSSIPAATPVPVAPVTPSAVPAATPVPTPATAAPVPAPAPAVPAPAAMPAPAASVPAAAPPVALAPAQPAVPPPPSFNPVPAAPVPAAAAASAGVKDLRIGEHAEATRLVLDLSSTSAYTADLDNNEHLLVVELPGAAWSGAKRGTAPKASTVSSWTVEPREDGHGSRLIVQLKKNAKISYERLLPATKTTSPKIVIDLAGQ